MPDVLVACEYSGTVRDAFRRRGFDAVSCDLLPSERPGPHLQQDVFTVNFSRYKMVIAHPPCQYLANSGVRWRVQRNEWAQVQMAAIFFKGFLNCAPFWAIENPVMHKHAGLPKPAFSVQPWQFGHNTSKRTCFWTNLPPLQPSVLSKPPDLQHTVHRMPPGPDRAKERARFPYELAEAMAEQWSAFI